MNENIKILRRKILIINPTSSKSLTKFVDRCSFDNPTTGWLAGWLVGNNYIKAYLA